MHTTIKTEAFVDEGTIIIVPEKAPNSIGEASVDLPLHHIVNLKVPEVETNGLEESIVGHGLIAHSHFTHALCVCHCNQTKKDQQEAKLLRDVFHFNYNN